MMSRRLHIPVITLVITMACALVDAYCILECGVQFQYNVTGLYNHHFLSEMIWRLVIIGDVLIIGMLLWSLFKKNRRQAFITVIALLIALFSLAIFVCGKILVSYDDVFFSYLNPGKITNLMLLKSVAYFTVPNTAPVFLLAILNSMRHDEMSIQ